MNFPCSANLSQSSHSRFFPAAALCIRAAALYTERAVIHSQSSSVAFGIAALMIVRMSMVTADRDPGG